MHVYSAIDLGTRPPQPVYVVLDLKRIRNVDDVMPGLELRKKGGQGPHHY